LTALVAGTTDLAAELRLGSALEHDDAGASNGGSDSPPRWPLLPHLSRIVLAARAYGLVALDGVCLDVKGRDGGASTVLTAECRQGRAMGFDGKTLIHPSQVVAANEAFSPSTSAVAHAKRVIQAVNAAAKAGEGVALVNGRLVEALHVTEAQRVLACADAIAARSAAVAKAGTSA